MCDTFDTSVWKTIRSSTVTPKSIQGEQLQLMEKSPGENVQEWQIFAID
jgi:hypothetical protein